MKVQAHWECSEILIALDGKECVLHQEAVQKELVSGSKRCWTNGSITEGCISLTVQEAKDLVASLQRSISNYEEMDRSIKEYEARYAKEKEKPEK